MHWVDDTFEDFIGLYEINDGKSVTLIKVIKDVLLQLILSLANIRGQCYDGASAMTGHKSGVAKCMQDIEPRAVFTHYCGHSLNLVVSDSVKACKMMKDVSETGRSQNLSSFHLKGKPFFMLSKRCSWDTSALSNMVEHGSIASIIIDNYEELKLTFDRSKKIVKDTEMKSSIIGVESKMNEFDFLFRNCDNLSKVLQSDTISANEGQRIANMTMEALISTRNESSFELLWKKVNILKEKYGINDAVLKRKCKTPYWLEHGSTYMEALDNGINCIKDQFNQPGYVMLMTTENLMLKCISKTNYDKEFQTVTDCYGNDLNKDMLRLHLETLQANIPADVKAFKEIVTWLKSLPPSSSILLSEDFTIVKPLPVIPATNSASERSFSVLRRFLIKLSFTTV